MTKIIDEFTTHKSNSKRLAQITILANQLLNAPAMNQLERNVIAADYQIPQENIISEMLDMRQAPQMICHELNDLP